MRAPRAALLLALAPRGGAARRGAAAAALRRDRRTPMRGVKPLSAALASNGSGGVLVLPALVTGTRTCSAPTAT